MITRLLIAAFAAIALCSCNTVPVPSNVSEVGSALSGSYSSQTGEKYDGSASSYVKFRTTDPKQVKLPARSN